MLLLHAITAAEAPGPPEARGGLRGYPLRRVEHGGLAAWATVWEPTARPLDRADLLASHTLLLELGDCVPARLPTWLADEAALEARLAERAAELAATLDRLRGTCELALTLAWRDGSTMAARRTESAATAAPAETTSHTAPPPTDAASHTAPPPADAASYTAPSPTDAASHTAPPRADAVRTARLVPATLEPGAGARYLRARQRALAEADERRARAEALRARVEWAAGSRLRGARHQLCPSERLALSSALLVPRAEAAAVRARLRGCLRRADDVRILVNGPWPPYTFVGLGREA